jgi:hypothetical protein
MTRSLFALLSVLLLVLSACAVRGGPDSKALNKGAAVSELSELSGRQIWMVNAPLEDCAKMEALGMIVDCEQGRDTMGMEHEIVIWCPEFEHAVAGRILDHLGRSDFSQRTHGTPGGVSKPEECGMLYEITIRYQSGASHTAAPPATAHGGAHSTIFSKDGTGPEPGPAPTGAGISELSELSGRQIWMVNAPLEDCAKMEALGMIVDCEQGRSTMGMEYEIVIWCTQFDHVIAPRILDHLGHNDFSIRTHQTYPAGTDDRECGMLFEITIRYEDAG